ncbi:hypothetical protein O1611_g5675 [Lasiodiplodia mahajangana]|uniref:Uncharacterized protein n=1 Tax=Lasiodiplodia mahajangana TaxID=1108764 RepID=A0ACC2JKZ7_9PEZI|nr:hypothetical protein O1611_g5675 [Lasiodiplodia mahajangana]
MGNSIDGPTPDAAAEAQRLVRQINEENGFLSEEGLDGIGPPDHATRRKVEIAMLRKDEIIGAGVLTLAKNLYTSSARFVFELLQNADDNNFSRATARREVPYVLFRIFSDKVILECNEDGFTSENLRALCAIGQSSKVGAQGYIGEKGIGFKSVFMAAWQVHIQSNAFSFTFTHRKGDSGMGMISPVWRAPEEGVDASVTRITLTLHQHDDPAIQEQQYNNIINLFNKLQGTSLLFLRKLRRVHLSFHNEAGIPTSYVEHSLHGIGRVTVRKTSWLDGGPKVLEDKLYHVTKHITGNVPASENRSYASEERRVDADTEIVLAFPLTKDSIPIDDENQDVFAFLPIKTMGFKFLMHTDFVTEASRQDIVITSRRNQGLRRGIADCFIKAVKQFSQHPTLQFQWMRWLPRRDAYPWGDFWQYLLDAIDARIKTSSIFRCQTGKEFKTISSLRELDHDFLDEAGNPLFRDLSPAIYLSQEYASTDLKILKPLGLRRLSINGIIDIVSTDLRSKDPSRIRGKKTDDDWHSRTARLLLSCLKKGTTEQRQCFLSMGLVPLSTGKWSSTEMVQLYYYYCEGGIEIPEGLNLELVSPIAAGNPERRALFDELGVLVAPIRFIQDKIFSLSQTTVNDDISSLQIAISHLSAAGKVRSAKKVWTYLPKCKLSELLRDCGYTSMVMHDAYLEEAPARPPAATLSWEDWLCQYLNLRRCLRLGRWDGERECMRASLELLSVSAKHPERVVDVLQTSFAFYKNLLAKSDSLVSRIKRLIVLDKSGREIQLGKTYLPLPELKEFYSRFAEGEEFPFLQLPDPITSGTYHEKWGFLVDTFGVGYIKDFNFYLRALEVISQFEDADVPIKRPGRFLDLYRIIQGACETSSDRDDARYMVKWYNEKLPLVFIPAYSDDPDCMVKLDACVWAGPGNLRTAYPLESLYTTRFKLAEADLESLRQYFKCTLAVPDCNWEHYTNEIRELKNSDDTDFDWINDLYHFLNDEREGMDESKEDDLQDAFESEPLIYADINGSSCWHTVSQCIWSSATQIQGRVPLNEAYPDLKEFFVDLLGVATLTLEMTHDELILKGSSDRTPLVRGDNDI